MKNLAAFIGLGALFAAASVADHHPFLALGLVVAAGILILPSTKK